MLIGGSNSTEDYINSMELVNMNTHQSSLELDSFETKVKGHSGGLMDNIPFFCGGVVSPVLDTKECFKYQNGSWTNFVCIKPSFNSVLKS